MGVFPTFGNRAFLALSLRAQQKFIRVQFAKSSNVQKKGAL